MTSASLETRVEDERHVRPVRSEIRVQIVAIVGLDVGAQRDVVAIDAGDEHAGGTNVALLLPVLRRQHLHSRFVLDEQDQHRAIELGAAPWPDRLDRGAQLLELPQHLSPLPLAGLGDDGEVGTLELGPGSLGSGGTGGDSHYQERRQGNDRLRSLSHGDLLRSWHGTSSRTFSAVFLPRRPVQFQRIRRESSLSTQVLARNGDGRLG
jgi:hypothetical protein